MEDKYLTIEAINKYLEYKFNIDKNLKDILVLAEISTLSVSGGHYYLTIKDNGYKMSAMMFKGKTYSLGFKPKPGDLVIIKGSISLYPMGGSYSLIIDKMMPSGDGAIKLALERLKNELASKGYFDQMRKKAIPKFPKTVAVITSPTGAVIRDVSATIRRRYSNLTLLIYPTLVQGKDAGNNISAQIIKANNDGLADVIIIGRGGGATEELACFNERAVCDAIYNSHIPVISAVGHERDDTLADLTADLRVSTPTAAGEKVTEEYIKVIDKLNYSLGRLNIIIDNKLNNYNNNLNEYNRLLSLCNPKLKLTQYRKEIDNNIINLNKIIDNKLVLNKDNINRKINSINNNILTKLSNDEHRFNYLIGKLSSINPAKLLDKGYSMTKYKDKYISSINELKINDEISVSLKDGNVKAIVKEIINE